MNDFPALEPRRFVFSVSQLNREAREALEGHFPLIWVEGELANLSKPGSGHWYFSLKDASAQVRCAMFRPRNRLLAFNPDSGMQVLVRAKLSLYEPRGDYQLLVEHMEEAGEGALRRAFDTLKQKLAAEGLFDPTHKKALPMQVRCVGVITSATGAAIHDILTVLRRRFPALQVVIYPVPVQGAEAPDAISEMIALAAARKECDVLIVGRGGGSLEDLWAFNEERVARAIHACPLPVISAVGHETDVTIADLVADVRAATPSAAAELVSPDGPALRQQIARLGNRLTIAQIRQFGHQRRMLEQLAKRVQHPGQRLLRQAQRMDELEQRLRQYCRLHLNRHERQLAQLQSRLLQLTPQHRLTNAQQRHDSLRKRLYTSINQLLLRQRARLLQATRTLEAVSPLATLQRGYTLSYRLPDKRLLLSVTSLTVGDQVETTLAQGSFISRVESITNEK